MKFDDVVQIHPVYNIGLNKPSARGTSRTLGVKNYVKLLYIIAKKTTITSIHIHISFYVSKKEIATSLSQNGFRKWLDCFPTENATNIDLHLQDAE